MTHRAHCALTPTQALEEKDKGNAAYKKKDFTTALQHYDKAIELDPENITFLTNKAGEPVHRVAYLLSRQVASYQHEGGIHLTVVLLK